MFSPNRLSIARKRRKLTRKELALRANLSFVTITRLEQEGNPDPYTIERLSGVLGFPVNFFYADDIDELDKASASFRSMKAMTARERDAALSVASLAYALSDWVGHTFNLPAVDIPDFGQESSPETAAMRLRSHWGLGEKPVGNIIKLLESKGVRVFSLCEETRNVDAFSCWRDNTPYIFLNTLKTAERSRFDALHELGHLVLHRHGGGQGREAEKEANAFASFFLMPTADLIAHLPFITSLNQLIRLKKRWGVSVTALAYRLNKSGAMTDWQYRTFCIQMNQNYGMSEPAGLERETSYIWATLLRELWNDGVTKETIANELSIPIIELENLVFGVTTKGVTPLALQPTPNVRLALISSAQKTFHNHHP